MCMDSRIVKILFYYIFNERFILFLCTVIHVIGHQSYNIS